ncbi:MAG: ROK family protein [Eubacteriales bacterium]|nr:ROK family protein [Eubacteriales bacterium]
MNYLGFDIGGTKSAVLLGNENGEILFREAISTGDPVQTLDTLMNIAGNFGGDPVSAGISCGGPLDEKKGVILSPPNLPGWDDIHVVDIISKHFSVPAKLYNDANACALAEWKFGAGRGSENMVFFTFGTGLGAGLILNGALYSGSNGNAGEAGHWRLANIGPVGYGKAGSFEGFCSGGGIKQLGQIYARELLQQGKAPVFCPDFESLDSISARSIAEAAYAGDPVAREIYSRCGEMLGRGLAYVIDFLNPDTVVIGSVFERAEDLLRPSMEKILEKECLPQALNAVKIVPAALGDSIGDKAALIAAVFAAKENHDGNI